MTTFKEHFYLISNACANIHEDNSLVSFKNTLPKKFETDRNEGFELAISSIGISNNFKNIPNPPNNLPNFIVTNCFETAGLCENDEGITNPCDLPKDFDANIDILTQNKFISGVHEFDYSGGITTDCKWFGYTFENKSYSLLEIQDFFSNMTKEVNKHISGATFEFTDNYRLKITSSLKAFSPSKFWFLMHKSTVENFNFQNTSLSKLTPTTEYVEVSDEPNFASNKLLRKYFIKDQEYFVYKIQTTSSSTEILTEEGDRKRSYSRDFLISNEAKNILDKKYPHVIRVLSDNITPQIFNGSYSKDLIVFSPDFETEKPYTYIEFPLKQYVPVSNTTLDLFSIRIVDENNYPIQLLPGPATVLKMDLRNRFFNKKTYNVRLTSGVSKEYPDNNNSIFKVKLYELPPLDRSYRVTITSISHPNTYSTFLKDENSRAVYFKEQTDAKRGVKVILPGDGILTEEEIVSIINEQLKKAKIGSANLIENKCVFTFESPQIFMLASNNLLKVLGYDETYNQNVKATKIYLVADKSTFNVEASKYDHLMLMENNSITMTNRMNLTILQPNYIMVYTNIVSKTIVGGAMSNILKLLPIHYTTDNYVMSEFKHKEYYELQNTEIDTVEIQLRAHDGEPINFNGSKDIIINLEFSNFPVLSS